MKKIFLYFFMYLLPLIIIYVLNIQVSKFKTCDDATALLRLKDANKTNFLHHATREFSISGIENFKFFSINKNTFKVTYVPSAKLLVAGIGDEGMRKVWEK